VPKAQVPKTQLLVNSAAWVQSSPELPALLPSTSLSDQSGDRSPKILLELQKVIKSFARTSSPAINQISLQLPQGKILALLGSSGCGKTTLLRLIAGFDQPQAGDILLSGRSITSLAPEARNVGMVFQDFALFPHLNVWQNVAFGLRRLSAINAKKVVSQALSLVSLTELSDRYPHQLSGGQQQRVALARAIAPNPDLILFDEPLSNLDTQIRLQLRRELRQILKNTDKTAIFVTHDQEEAMHLADLIAVMRLGKIEQIGSPEQIYQQPASRFVAEFVCQANFLPAVHLSIGSENFWHTEIGDFAIPNSLSSEKQSDSVDLMIRQDAIELEAATTGIAIVSDRLFVGRDLIYYLNTRSGQELVARVNQSDHQAQIAVGESVNLRIREKDLRTFCPESGLYLG